MGHPWPCAAIPASMPGCPLRNACVRPAWFNGASRSRSKAEQQQQQQQQPGISQICVAERPLSRASSLPHWIFSSHPMHIRRRTLWERVCSRRGQCIHIIIDCDNAFASRLAPTGETRSPPRTRSARRPPRDGRRFRRPVNHDGRSEAPSGGAKAFGLLLTGPASGLLKSDPL